VKELLARDFIAKAEDDAEKLDIAVKYALGYKHAFIQLQDMAVAAHLDARSLAVALDSVRTAIPTMSDDIAATMRMLGGVCQLIKVFMIIINI